MRVIFTLVREIYMETDPSKLNKFDLMESLSMPIIESDLILAHEYFTKLRKMGHRLPVMHQLEHIAIDRLSRIVETIIKPAPTGGTNGEEKIEVHGVTTEVNRERVANSSEKDDKRSR